MNKFEKKELDGEFLGHVACLKHGGSDSLALYRQDDSLIDGMCFSECGFISTKELIELGVLDDTGENVLSEFVSSSGGKVFKMTEEIGKRLNQIKNMEVSGWKDFRIPKSVFEFYGVKNEFDSEGNLTYQYCPCTRDDEIVGYHVRNNLVKLAKNRGEKPTQAPFFALGEVKSDCQLFGQSLFTNSGKYNDTVVLCAGEKDVLCMFTTLNVDLTKGGKIGKYVTPVVSTMVGEAARKQIRNNYEFLTGFKHVVICYDNDEAGKKGALEIARMLPSGSAKIMKIHRKDVAEHTSKGEFDAVRQAFYNAEPFSPVDILHLNQMWDSFEDDDNNVKIPFPSSWSRLNEMMGGGMERGEVTVIGGLTSAGKSSIINNLIYNTIENTDFKVGAMLLETTTREVVRDMLSLDMSINLRIADRSKLDMGALKQRFFDYLVKKDQFVYVNHNGSLSNEKIFDKLNYLAKAEQCDMIVVDPLQAAVNSSDNSAVIEFMDTILKFAKETDTCVVLVSHMRKPSSENPHEVSEYHLMGCVDEETEFLSQDGWKNICDYQLGDKVMNYNIKTGVSYLEEPVGYIKKPADKFYHFKSQRGVDMVVSPEHRMIYKWQDWDYKFETAENIYEKHQKSGAGFSGRFPTTFSVDNVGIDITENDLRMAVAFQADGHQRKDLKEGNATFAFKKKRKIDRLLMLISKGSYKSNDPFLSAKGVWTIRVHIPVFFKEFPIDWWMINKEQAEIIMDEYVHWDGYKNTYTTTSKNNADFMQYVFTLCGYRSRIRKEKAGGENQKDVYSVRYSKNNSVCIANKDKKPEITVIKPEDGVYKYCFTTSTSAWVARRNGCVFPTGNSASINQIAFNTILMSRDKMADTELARNSTRLQLVKCRRTGETGEAGWLRYDNTTTHLYAGVDPYSDELDELCNNTLDNVHTFTQKPSEVENVVEIDEADYY